MAESGFGVFLVFVMGGKHFWFPRKRPEEEDEIKTEMFRKK